MKKSKSFFISILFLLVGVNIFGALRDESDALNIANGFLNKGLLRSSAGSLDLVYTAEDDSKSPCFYIFNSSTLKKFVIVSAQDKTNDILGYSDNSIFNLDSIPYEMKFLLSYYTVNISAIAKDSTYKAASDDDNVYNRSLSFVKPLLGDNNYNQIAPFNSKCPSLGDEKCVVGCGALSVVQIMSFNKWPLSSKGSVSYEYVLGGDTIPVSQNLETSYDWDNIKGYYDDESTQVQKDAIAKLCYNTALACKMQFGVDGSSSENSEIVNALVNNFKYDSDIRAIFRVAYSQGEWNRKIKSELSDNRPLELFASSSSVGHAFVCDGFDEDDLFHINWGWSGFGNGYYDLSIMSLQNETNYNYNLMALLDIKKEDGISSCAIPYSLEGFISCSNENDFSTNINLSFGELKFENAFAKSCYLALALYSAKGEVEKVVDIKMDGLYSMSKYISSFSYGFTLPNDIADGSYTIALVYKDNLESDWQKVNVADPSKSIINVKVQNSKVSCSISKEIKDFDLCIDGLGTDIFYNNGQKRTIRVDVKNDGDEYYNDVSIKLVSVSDTTVSFLFPDNRLLFIPKGESRTFLFTGVMDNLPQGSYYVSLKYKDENISEGSMVEKIYTKDTLVVSNEEVPFPRLSIVSTDINQDVYNRNNLSVAVRIRNTGGDYCGKILLRLSNNAGSYLISSCYANIVKEEVVSLKGAKTIPYGKYKATFIYSEGSTYSSDGNNKEIESSTDYYMNIGDINTRLEDGGVDDSDVVNCFYSKDEESLMLDCSDVCISRVVVYSITGKKMLVSRAKNKISISGLANGVYIAEVFFDDGRSKRIKFIK